MKNFSLKFKNAEDRILEKKQNVYLREFHLK